MCKPIRAPCADHRTVPATRRAGRHVRRFKDRIDTAKAAGIPVRRRLISLYDTRRATRSRRRDLPTTSLGGLSAG